MTTVQVYDEARRNIGYINHIGATIYYYTYKHGLVGQYDTVTKQYRRFKSIPGKPIAPLVGTGDYGEADIRYWGSM